MSDLVVDHVSFQYVTGRHIALRNVNLTIPAGQVVLLAGASGCGKTTLGYAIAGGCKARITAPPMAITTIRRFMHTAASSYCRPSHIAGT